MAFQKIKDILKESIGLHSDSVGESSIERAISHRMQCSGSIDAESYFNLLKSSELELEELIEEVVVPETWFFRNSTPFAVLVDCVKEIINRQFLSKKNNINASHPPPVKILSIPCSTGEEPYSIAMVLSDKGYGENDYHIDAIDVSKRALAKARRAIYGRHSFREDHGGFQEKYFEKIINGWQLSADIANRVTFSKSNIITDKISPTENHYDIIFCRNLLIYFTRETQKHVLEKLTSMLKYDGILFVGHAEAGQVDTEKYSQLNVAKAFAFRKRRSDESEKLTVSYNSQPINKLKDIYNQLVEVTKKDIEFSKKIMPNPKKLSKDNNGTIWKNIETLIANGKLTDASTLCEKHMENFPEEADAYYYLGLISDLEGSVGAAESLLKKAIYLSPNHQKALALSAYLADKRGDINAAKTYRRRVKNARSRNI